MSSNIYPLQTIDPTEMTNLYKITPPRHAEKAYQPNQGDKFPTLSTVPTTIGSSQYLVVLLTNLFNRYPWGRAEVQIIDYDDLIRYAGGTFPTPEVAQKIIANYPQVVIAHCAGMTPCKGLINLPENRVTVRVLTGGHKAKALDLADVAAAGLKV